MNRSALRPTGRTATALGDLRLPGFLFFLLSGGFMTVIMLGASLHPATTITSRRSATSAAYRRPRCSST